MTRRVKDILINVDNGDLLFSSGDGKSVSYYDVVWDRIDGVLCAIICMSDAQINELKADEFGRCKIYFHTDYQPYAESFRIRLAIKTGDSYVFISQSACAFPVTSTAYFPFDTENAAYASELPYVNLDGNYVANLVPSIGGDKAFIYSAVNLDFRVGISDEQSAQLISLCGPCKYYRYPLTGVDITKYVNTVVSNSDLSRRISEEFNKDNIDAQGIGFDSSTGKLNVRFKYEEGKDSQSSLVDVDSLDFDSIDVTDDMLAEVAETIDFMLLDADYDDIETDGEVPEAWIKSCFANGIWIGEYFWTGDLYWKGTE